MIKHLFLIVFITFFFQSVHSQNIQISGKVTGVSSGNTIKNAVVMIINEQDSTIENFVRTKTDGSYNFSNVTAGKKIIMVTHPLYADYIDTISFNKQNENIPSIVLTDKSKLLEAIIIKSGGSIKIKGDTTIYTADSFNVSANANVEELLKKLPGIQVDKNGEIKAMGEKVEKVLVDGEEFFGDDPGMAVKNIRADAVKEVQVFDKKSDQAAFTGIDDGNTKKTINLKLKDDRKKG
jgi:hypothetical protein